VLTRPGVVRAAPTLPGTTRIRLPQLHHPAATGQRRRSLTSTRTSALHGAPMACATAPASLAHSAKVDLKTVQAQLGHSSIVLTADTYTSVLTDLLAYAAEATARLVLAAAARNPGRRHRRNDHSRKSAAPAEIATGEQSVSRPSDRAEVGRRSRPHSSHQRPTKIKGA
jgi:hypothetical protein